MTKCKKCGNTDNYNFTINNGLCNGCIEEELDRLEAEKHAMVLQHFDDLAACKQVNEQLQSLVDTLKTEALHNCEFCTKTDQLQADLDKLKEFARHVIEIECWSIYEQDGFELQDLAEKLSLIEPHIATQADVEGEFGDFEVGDKIYKFTEALKGGE